MKLLIFIGGTLGSIIGGYVPVIFGVDPFSLTSVLLSGIGGIIGTLLGYKLGRIILD